jgi:hypothetical protein
MLKEDMGLTAENYKKMETDSFMSPEQHSSSIRSWPFILSSHHCLQATTR